MYMFMCTHPYSQKLAGTALTPSKGFFLNIVAPLLLLEEEKAGLVTF
jgi:hypothetical protein